jgi:hypothetical protein
MTANGNPPPDPALAALCQELSVHETRVWQALVDGDAAADAAALAHGFLGVYPSGFATSDDHVGQLAAGPTVDRFALSQMRVMTLGPDHAVLSYFAQFRRVAAMKDEAMYVSSIWQRAGDGWINVFSQDTPAARV